jgi:cell division protein FtsB
MHLMLHASRAGGQDRKPSLIRRVFSSLPRFRPRRPATSRERIFRYAIGALMLFTLCTGDRGLFKLAGLLHDRASIEKEVRDLDARKERLKRDLASCTSDPVTIEKLARESLDMVKKGETVYKFPPK